VSTAALCGEPKESSKLLMVTLKGYQTLHKSSQERRDDAFFQPELPAGGIWVHEMVYCLNCDIDVPSDSDDDFLSLDG